MPRRLLLVAQYRVPATWLSITTTYAAGAYGIWQGIGILTSPDSRFGSPAFEHIRDAPAPWGVSALLLGCCVLFGIIRRQFLIKAVGLAGLSLLSLGFGSLSLTAYLSNPTAAPTGPPAYYFIAVNLGILVWAKPKGRVHATEPDTR
jgi:hypothetical protein